jgi:hypothetical protein
VGREQAAVLIGFTDPARIGWASLLDMGLPNSMPFGASPWEGHHWRANKRSRADKACTQCSNHRGVTRLKWQTRNKVWSSVIIRMFRESVDR